MALPDKRVENRLTCIYSITDAYNIYVLHPGYLATNASEIEETSTTNIATTASIIPTTTTTTATPETTTPVEVEMIKVQTNHRCITITSTHIETFYYSKRDYFL